jgi:hypothetical protein
MIALIEWPFFMNVNYNKSLGRRHMRCLPSQCLAKQVLKLRKYRGSLRMSQDA